MLPNLVLTLLVGGAIISIFQIRKLRYREILKASHIAGASARSGY